MAVSRIHGDDLNEYVRWFKDYADQIEEPALRAKVWQLSSELGPLDRKLAGQSHEREQWMQKLDELQGALAACDAAQGVGSACNPFYVRVDRIISECSHQSPPTTKESLYTPSLEEVARRPS
jgi:hypothetical protein